MNENIKKDKKMTIEDFREIVIAFQKSRIILTAIELGIFKAIGNGRKTSKEVAQKLGTDERATDRLMNALCVLNLLDKKYGEFSNTSFSLRYLVEGSTDYLGGLKHTAHLWDTWSNLTEAVRKGRAVGIPAIQQRGSEWLKAFIAAMHDRAKNIAPHIVSLLDLKNIKKILDVGGGSGAYAMAFVKSSPDIKATIFDLPEVIPITRNYINKEGLSSKIQLISGDYNKDNLPKGYDLIFLSSIIHSNSTEINEKLIKKCAASLNLNGQLVIQDFIVDENRISPPQAVIFALNMLVATEAGDTYTEAEIKNWLKKAGITNILRRDTKFNTTLIIGKK